MNGLRSLGVLLLGSIVACGGSSTPPPLAPAPAASAIEVAPAAPLPQTSVRRSAVRRAIAAGPGMFLQRIELDEHPVRTNGRFQGFRVVALKGGPAFWEGIDLRPGDVVKLVNGRSIERPQEAFETFHSLETAREIRIDLDREGEARTLKFDIVEDEPTPPSTAKPAAAPAPPPTAKPAAAPAPPPAPKR